MSASSGPHVFTLIVKDVTLEPEVVQRLSSTLQKSFLDALTQLDLHNGGQALTPAMAELVQTGRPVARAESFGGGGGGGEGGGATVRMVPRTTAR